MALLIHLFVPLVGLRIYLWLCQRMRQSKIPSPPYWPLLFLFISVGGWLLVLLTLRFWYWSGMASAGLAYLLFVAPVIMTVAAATLFNRLRESKYHFWAFVASTSYPIIIGLVLAGQVLLKNK